jgi:hypothetical protein
MSKIAAFEGWLNELVWSSNSEVEDYVQILAYGAQGQPGKPSESVMKVRFYTSENKYFIIAIDRDDDTSYLGCQVQARKWRPGENWFRGNDLPDGELRRETWEQIKNAIIAYELEKLSVKAPDTPIALMEE